MGLADIFYRFGVSLIIGFLIGIQREYAYVKEENRPDIDQTLFAGARTFSLLGLYGCAAAFMGEAAGAFWVTVALLLPVGLGTRGGEINEIFRNVFTRIVLNGEDIQTVLDEEGASLQTLLDETGAPCWPPDAPSEGACQLQ